jgi:hypothetical protein
LTVTAAPTPVESVRRPDLLDYLPRVSAWQSGYYALHEWIGLLWYRLR